MRNLRIFAFGLTAAIFLVALLFVRHQIDVAHAATVRTMLNELTPEKTIVLCGSPESDDVNYISGIDERLGQGRLAASRELLYKKKSAEGWAKLEFIPQFGSGAETKSWRLAFFGSPSIGTTPDGADAHFIPDELPCLGTGTRKR